jgi:four helix bundle protein
MTFEDLECWKEARKLVKQVYDMSRSHDLARDFGITGQIQRASVSIMSNIAEGFERSHVQEKLQFYNVARSSSAEVRSLTYVIEDNFPTAAATAILVRDQTVQTGKIVTGLIQSTEHRRSGKAVLGFLLSLFAIS